MNTPILRFMKYRKGALLLSSVLLLISIFSLFNQGLNFGLDFTGGTLLEVKYNQPIDVNDIRTRLENAKYKDVTVQNFGSETDILIRMSEAFREDLGQEVLQKLQTDGNPVTLLRNEFVGANVGEELRDDGGLALLLAIGIVMLYVAARFQYKFALGAALALFHDVLLVIGFFSLFNLDFDLTVLAALLAVIGYSLNDTIVVYDRIRENFRIVRRSDSAEVIDISLTQTLSRTIMTSLTTALVLIALMFVGGEMIFNFALAMLVGVIVGTYSSVYVSSSLLLLLNASREDLIPPELEEEIDTMP